MDKDLYQEKSRKKLNDFIDLNKNKMLGKLLAIVEVLSPNEFQWKKTRTHILGICNDFTRDIQFEIEQNYALEYVSTKEDIIQVIPPKLKGGEQ